MPINTNNSAIHFPGYQPPTQQAQAWPTVPQENAGAHDASQPSLSPSGRPHGDRRTAYEIQRDNPFLDEGPLYLSSTYPKGGPEKQKELINEVKQHVGDFMPSNKDPESRADAMYNLAQVFKHIDAEPKPPGQSAQRSDGYLSNSEQDRVREFAAKGYGALKPLDQAPTQNTVPTAHAGLTPGDNRSLEQITANPLFKALDAPTPSSVLKDFQKVLGGDWNNPKFPEHIRRHIAADAERVLQYIDKSVGDEPKRNNGVIEGTFHSTYKLLGETLSPEDFTLDNSPARKLVQFSQQGYRALSN